MTARLLTAQTLFALSRPAPQPQPSLLSCFALSEFTIDEASASKGAETTTTSLYFYFYFYFASNKQCYDGFVLIPSQ